MTRANEIAALRTYAEACIWGHQVALKGIVLSLEDERALTLKKIELKEAEKR